LKDIRILVPSIGHPTRPSLAEAMRGPGDRHVTIVGADMDGGGIAPHVPDEFVQVPGRTDPGYIDRVLEICRDYAIDVYYALGEEEAIGSAERLDEFKAQGVGVITPGNPDMLRLSSNKSRYHEFFNEQGIPAAGFKTIATFAELEDGLKEMGFPEIDVFLKPTQSKGGRGARLVTASDDPEVGKDVRAAGQPVMSLETCLEEFRRQEGPNFPELIAMEYLPGTYYSCDVLSRDGEVLYAVPKIRVRGTASNTTVGQVDMNPAVLDMAQQACNAFGYSFMQNYEMKLDKNGEPRIYDINPRGGTSLILCKAAGANIAWFAVLMALGEEIPKAELKDGVRMLRHFREYFDDGQPPQR
jgi:carbamoyl-phosphate synthase large subunit